MVHWYLIKFKKNLQLFLIAISLILLISGCLILNVYYQLYLKNLNIKNINNNDGYILEVLSGERFKSVINQLKEKQIIPSFSSYSLNFVAKISGYDKKIKTGEYLITSKMTPIQLIHKLIEGDVVLHRFTVIEGWRFQQLLDALQNHSWINHTITDEYTCGYILKAIDRNFNLNLDSFSEVSENNDLVECEGLFMPDTYFFPKNTKDLIILQKSYDAMQHKLKNLWANSKQNVLKSPYEALIMASIIEKETSLVEEMPRVSGVYHNRLSMGMRLQADPTVMYGSKIFDRPLTRKDLKLPSKYNTYTNKGLPPAPIAIPSYYSILAALNPIQEDYLYFVADGSGGHVFSSTFVEHIQAIAKIKNYNNTKEIN